MTSIADKTAHVLSQIAHNGRCYCARPSQELLDELSGFGVGYVPATQEFYKAGVPTGKQTYRLRLIETRTLEVEVAANSYQEAIAKAEQMTVTPEYQDHKWEEVNED